MKEHASEAGTAAPTRAAQRLLRSPWLRAAVFVVVLGAWGWFLGSQLDELRRYSWRLGVLPLLASITWGAFYFGGLALCWTLLLRTMGGAARAVGLTAGAYIWLSTMLARYVPGNIWHIVGRVALAGRLGVSKSQVAASATVEQLLTLMGAATVFGLSLPFWRGGAGGERWLLLLIPLGLAALHPRVLGALLGWAALRLGRPELAWPYRYGTMLALLGAFAASNFAAGMALYVIVATLTLVTPAQLPFVVGAAALAWALGYLSLLTPSGLGVREAILTTLLAQIFPLPVAIIASLLHRLTLTLGEVVAVGLIMLLVRLRPAPG